MRHSFEGRLAHLGLTHRRLTHMGLTHLGLTHRRLTHLGLTHRRLTHLGLTHLGLTHRGLTQLWLLTHCTLTKSRQVERLPHESSGRCGFRLKVRSMKKTNRLTTWMTHCLWVTVVSPHAIH